MCWVSFWVSCDAIGNGRVDLVGASISSPLCTIRVSREAEVRQEIHISVPETDRRLNSRSQEGDHERSNNGGVDVSDIEILGPRGRER